MLSVELSEAVVIAWHAVRTHKLRAVLTTLGVIIGVLAVTLMSAAIYGVRQAFLDALSRTLGPDTLYVSRTDWVGWSETELVRQRKRRLITLEQARKLEQLLETAVLCVPIASGFERIEYGGRSVQVVSVVGSTEGIFQIQNNQLAEGRFFTRADSEGSRPVCVVGAVIAENLFKGHPAVGNWVWIGNQRFEVIGVLEKEGAVEASSDSTVYIPIGQFIAHLDREPDLVVGVKFPAPEVIDRAREELRGAMRRVRRLAPAAADDFAIISQDSVLAMFGRVTRTIAGIGLFITGLALFVGGIGIMNIMFVAVAERTREIGIRKAVGATRRAILLQFLIEAAGISLLGGVIALGLAWPTVLLMREFMPAALVPGVVFFALVLALLTGLIAGFVPAWRAANLKPVDALRSE